MDGAASALAYAEKIASQPMRQGWTTSISGVIDMSIGLFGSVGEEPMQRVIDITGNRPNNDGRKVTVWMRNLLGISDDLEGWRHSV